MGLRILRRNSAGRLQKSIERLEGWQLCAPLTKRLDDLFGRDVADQRILCKGTAAQSTDRGIETATTCVVGGLNFSGRLIHAAVQMHADFEVVVLRHHCAYQV